MSEIDSNLPTPSQNSNNTQGRHRSVIKTSLDAVIANRRLIIRALLTCAYYAMIFYILKLLFFHTINAEYRDMVNMIIGAILASFTSVTQFWFKKDSETTSEEE